MTPFKVKTLQTALHLKRYYENFPQDVAKEKFSLPKIINVMGGIFILLKKENTFLYSLHKLETF